VKTNLLSYIFFVNTNFTKLQIISFCNVEEKNLANFKKIIELLPKKLSQSSKEYGLGIRGSEIRDPGSGKKPIPDPGSRGQKGTGSGSATLTSIGP
jgi:hypothetical protein